MKKTKIISTSISNLDRAIKYLESDGWEVVDFRNTNLSNGEVYIFLMAQKEEDKSIYEKMYLLEKYCFNYHSEEERVCKGCRIENMCDKYEGNGSIHWDFEDVAKAYEEIRDGDR